MKGPLSSLIPPLQAPASVVALPLPPRLQVLGVGRHGESLPEACAALGRGLAAGPEAAWDWPLSEESVLQPRRWPAVAAEAEWARGRLQVVSARARGR